MRENHFPPGTLSLVPRVSTASPSPSSTASFNPLVPLPPPIPIPAAAAVCGPPENRHSSPAPLRGCFPAVLFCTARKVASHLQSRPLHMLGRNVVRTWRERERERKGRTLGFWLCAFFPSGKGYKYRVDSSGRLESRVMKPGSVDPGFGIRRPLDGTKPTGGTLANR